MFAKYAQIKNEVWDLDLYVCFEFLDGLVYLTSGLWIRRHGKTGVSLKNSARCTMLFVRGVVSYKVRTDLSLRRLRTCTYRPPFALLLGNMCGE
jgi:hypothetical protein